MNVFIILIALLIIFLVFTLKSNNKKKYSFDEAFIRTNNIPIQRQNYTLESSRDIRLENIVTAIETKILQDGGSLPNGIHNKIYNLLNYYGFHNEYLQENVLMECIRQGRCNLNSPEIQHGIIHYAIKQWIMYSNSNTFDHFIMFMKNLMEGYTKNRTPVDLLINNIQNYTRYELNF